MDSLQQSGARDGEAAARSDAGDRPAWLAAAGEIRGRITIGASLKETTWFRVGGPADVLFTPADTEDLAAMLAATPTDVPVTVLGLASNTLVRDGGVPGLVIRLTRAFNAIEPLGDSRIACGTGVPDVKLARAAADAEIDGLAFYRGIPGGIGGALRMNAGAHGAETKDVLEHVEAVDRAGRVLTLSCEEMGYTYRHCSAPADLIFTRAVFRGRPGKRSDILAQMDEVAAYREEHQPTRERTGGSTFKNPPGHSAWKLVDAAGMRGFRVGGAQVSQKHCNFLINDQEASARDIEQLGETVRARVKAHSGVTLEWEIKRIGRPLGNEPTGEALALAPEG